MRKVLRYALLLLVVLAAAVWLNNTSIFSPPSQARPTLLAHRGVAQTFPHDGVDAETCTATRIYPPEHSYIENTLPSMRAAFDAGADVVEFDIHPTTDGQFAVFHDWTLDCRTDGKGVTREHTLAELKTLDAGFGYTADGGKTFPLRGKGVGMIPSLDEVLAAFPGKRFLIHVKSNDAGEGEQLAAYLAKLAPEQRKRLIVYGGTPPVDLVHRRLPAVAAGSKRALKECLVRYLAIGWSGHVPEACRSGLMLVPSNIAPWLWGWPDKFLDRMQRAGVQVFVLGPYDGGQFSSGVDDLAALAELPEHFAGGIWTNRIDRIGPAVQSKQAPEPIVP